jgi:DNA-binding HxlR family transcriptional regulator
MSRSGESYVERDRCPVYTAIHVIEGRWKPMICRRLGEGPHGFGELHRVMPGVTVKVLRQHLRQLEEDGIVARSVRKNPALRLRYRLTPHGRTLGPVFETLWTWGVRHLARRSVTRERLSRSQSKLDTSRQINPE